MRLWVLGSGSRGNALLMESGGTRVLVDAGFAPRVLARRLRAIDVDPGSISALVVTHEHQDHARGACAAAKRWGWPVHASAGTLGALCDLAAVARSWLPGEKLAVGELTLEALPLEHDAAEPIGLLATSSSGVRCGVAYDLGRAGGRLRARLRDLDLLVLETNHDRPMLRNGPYPRVVQDRIDGPRGHLSNEAAAEVARESAHRTLSHIVLAHISEQCNTPARAVEVMRGALRATRFRGVIHATSQDAPCGPFTATTSRAVQLGLAI